MEDRLRDIAILEYGRCSDTEESSIHIEEHDHQAHGCCMMTDVGPPQSGHNICFLIAFMHVCGIYIRIISKEVEKPFQPETFSADKDWMKWIQYGDERNICWNQPQRVNKQSSNVNKGDALNAYSRNNALNCIVLVLWAGQDKEKEKHMNQGSIWYTLATTYCDLMMTHRPIFKNEKDNHTTMSEEDCKNTRTADLNSHWNTLTM